MERGSLLKGILLLTLWGVLCDAEIIAGYFNGKMFLKNGKKTYQEVDVFVKTVQKPVGETVITSSYGLILSDGQGSIYRIEELADGTLVWLNLFQGSNHILRVNSNYDPEYKGNFFVKKRKNNLRLTPTSYRKDCTDKEIVVTQSSKREWLHFPDQHTVLKNKEKEESELNGDDFNGYIRFDSQGVSKSTYKLGMILPSLATVRPSIVSSTTLSGWELEREMVGAAVSVYVHTGAPFCPSKYYILYFLKLPSGEKQCQYDISEHRMKW